MVPGGFVMNPDDTISNYRSIDGKIPRNIEAEMYVLASLILYAEVYENIVEINLNFDDFFDERHQYIFRAIKELKEDNKPVQIISVTEKLNVDKVLSKAGGSEYISSLLDQVPTSAFASYYAEIVKKKSTLRKLIYTSSEIISKSYDNPEDVRVLLDEAEKKILDINQEVFSSSFSHIKDVVNETIQHIMTQKRREGELSGIPTGFSDLDEKTDGFQKSELIIIAARPSAGKTAFALNTAANMALRYQKGVGIFSCEMSKNSLMIRMLCSEAKVNQLMLRKNMISAQDQQKLAAAAEKLYETNIVFDDTPNIPVLELRSKARKMKKEYHVDIIMVDYLGLVSLGNEMGTSIPRHEQIAYISKSLKSLARELEIPVVALAQLNRNVESRGGDEGPRMSDLRDSGSIEQDADLIMFLHRKNLLGEGDTDIRQLIIGKNRNGPTDIIELAFLKNFTKFQLSEKTTFDGG